MMMQMQEETTLATVRACRAAADDRARISRLAAARLREEQRFADADQLFLRLGGLVQTLRSRWLPGDASSATSPIALRTSDPDPDKSDRRNAA